MHLTIVLFTTAAPLLAMRALSGQQAPRGVAHVVIRDGGYDASPAPDGRRMVYVRSISGREQLIIASVDGSDAAQITHDSADHEDPAWSPDGQWIAYVRATSGHEILHRMHPDGGSDAVLTPDSIGVIHPTWSTDSRRILFCSDDDLHPPAKNASAIYVLDVARGQTKVLVSGGTNTYPSLSPDGRTILFRRMVGPKISAVFIARPDGRGARNLTPQAGWDGWPEWSPDGRTVAFASNRPDNATNWQVFLMDPDGNNVRLLARTRGRATAPHWARDGRSIYFTNCMGQACAVMRVMVRR